ncbi:metal ABC transporter permease [Streptococcus hillyeri]|uniref:Metal ABC transporter permease n=1 Tax=Streptococcus hillyeri TaxID=2282420 RepID=A0A3L9DVI1_9STRE|nr:metal ABC transporter permease [Streptococcus hillyeri]RLY04354.1 metal ABC transporter permease [Streptococcus hillyeri]
MSEVLLILLLMGLSCGLLGSLLVLRNQSMLADALAHSVLLGIVLGFFVARSLDSPILVLGATLFGVLAVFAIESISSGNLTHDAATGLVFTTFFALGVILISVFARNVHLDLDIVLMGEVLFTPLNRIDILGMSLPVALAKSAGLLLVVLLFFGIFYNHLKLFLFDRNQAQLSRLSVKALQIVIVFLVSLTVVIAFDIAGSITVISFLVAPAMAAQLWSRHFHSFLGFVGLFSSLMVIIGYVLGIHFDLSLSGICAVTGLGVYVLALLVRKLKV